MTVTQFINIFSKTSYQNLSFISLNATIYNNCMFEVSSLQHGETVTPLHVDVLFVIYKDDLVVKD